MENPKIIDVFNALSESCDKDCELINARLAFWRNDVRFMVVNDEIPRLAIVGEDDNLPF